MNARYSRKSKLGIVLRLASVAAIPLFFIPSSRLISLPWGPAHETEIATSKSSFTARTNGRKVSLSIAAATRIFARVKSIMASFALRAIGPHIERIPWPAALIGQVVGSIVGKADASRELKQNLPDPSRLRTYGPRSFCVTIRSPKMCRSALAHAEVMLRC